MSSVPTSEDRVVVLAAGPEFARIRDILEDWSALGLVAATVLVDTDAIRPSEHRVPCLVLERSGSRPGVLQDVLAETYSTGSARVVAISRVTATVSTPGNDAALDVHRHVTNALPALQVPQIHLIGMELPSGTRAPDLGELAWLGWHNLVVAPEHALGPLEAVSPIVQDGSATGTVQLAAALCTAAGLWVSGGTASLDDVQVPPGRSFTAARFYTRHLSAERVEYDLIDRLAAVGGEYPLPRIEDTSAERIDDPVAASRAMATDLVALHPQAFARQRRVAQAVAREKRGGLAMIKMFFAFFVQAIKNAPRAFADAVVHRVSAGTAAVLQRALLGAGDPAYTIVVNGVRADGKPASWEEIDQALEAVGARAGETVHEGQANVSDLWQDYVGGAQALLDAGSRHQMTHRSVGTKRGVISDPNRVVPDPADCFEVDPQLTSFITPTTLEPSDFVGSRQLHDQLGRVSGTYPHLTSAAERSRSELVAFFTERERTYAGALGGKIRDDIGVCRSQLAEYARTLQSIQDSEQVSSGIYDQQVKLARVIKFILLGFGVALVAVIVLGALGVIGAALMAGLAIALVIGWFVSSLWTFVRGQAALFSLLNQRADQETAREVLLANSQAARADLRRLLTMNRQFMDWTRALGSFLQAPMGRPAEAHEAGLLIGTGFPRNHRFGVATPDATAIEQVATQLRPRLFPGGWLARAWDAFLIDVPAMGQERHRVVESREILFSDPQVARESVLTSWSRAASARAWDGGSNPVKAELQHVLNTSGSNLMGTLISQVQVREPAGGTQLISLDLFLNRLEESEHDGTHTFQRTLFSSTQGGEPWKVLSTQVDRSTRGFSETLLVTQLSRAFSVEQLASAVSPLDSHGPVTPGSTSYPPDHPEAPAPPPVRPDF